MLLVLNNNIAWYKENMKMIEFYSITEILRLLSYECLVGLPRGSLLRSDLLKYLLLIDYMDFFCFFNEIIFFYKFSQ